MNAASQSELTGLQAQGLLDADQVRKLFPLSEAYEAALKAAPPEVAQLMTAQHAYLVGIAVELNRLKNA